MTHPELETAVHEALRRVLKRVHGDGPSPNFDGKTKPIGDLGLDSMAGVGFLCELEVLGIILADNLNPFVDDAKRQVRSVNEMIQFIEIHAQVGGETE